PATTSLYTLSLHDALPIFALQSRNPHSEFQNVSRPNEFKFGGHPPSGRYGATTRPPLQESASHRNANTRTPALLQLLRRASAFSNFLALRLHCPERAKRAPDFDCR